MSSGTTVTRRGLLTLGVAVPTVLTLGCSSDEGAAPATGQPTSRQVTDAYGPVSMPAAPQRVVADSVGTLAHLTALGLLPIAAALPVDIDPAYLGEDAAAVDNVVAEDGWTIAVEKALALRPDLVVAVAADYNEENCERYKAAMTTYCFEDGWRDIEDITTRFLSLGEALGRTEQATEAVADFEAKVAEVRERVESEGLSGLDLGVVRFDGAGFIGVRSADVVNAVISSLGYSQPTWPKTGDSGYVELSMETLDVLDRADVLLVTTDDNVEVAEMDVFESELWNRLRAVRDGDAHFVGAWNGSDLIQLGIIVDAISDATL